MKTAGSLLEWTAGPTRPKVDWRAAFKEQSNHSHSPLAWGFYFMVLGQGHNLWSPNHPVHYGKKVSKSTEGGKRSGPPRST